MCSISAAAPTQRSTRSRLPWRDVGLKQVAHVVPHLMLQRNVRNHYGLACGKRTLNISMLPQQVIFRLSMHFCQVPVGHVYVLINHIAMSLVCCIISRSPRVILHALPGFIDALLASMLHMRGRDCAIYSLTFTYASSIFQPSHVASQP